MIRPPVIRIGPLSRADEAAVQVLIREFREFNETPAAEPDGGRRVHLTQVYSLEAARKSRARQAQGPFPPAGGAA